MKPWERGLNVHPNLSSIVVEMRQLCEQAISPEPRGSGMPSNPEGMQVPIPTKRISVLAERYDPSEGIVAPSE